MSKKDYRVFYDNYMNTNAATEATGLITSGEYSQEEWDAYREVFNFEPVPHRECMESTDTGTSMVYSPSNLDEESTEKK